MKLENLVPYFRNPDQFFNLIKENGLDEESEVILIYMKDSLSINAEIVLFEYEKTLDEVVFYVDDEKYIQLFPFEHAVEIVNDFLDLGKGEFSDLEVAEKLLNYRVNDA